VLGRFATEREITAPTMRRRSLPRSVPGRARQIAYPPCRIPSLTPEAQKTAAAERDFRVALLQSPIRARKTCRAARVENTNDDLAAPRRSLPRYNTGRLNRDDGPEDSSLAVRCLTSDGLSLAAPPAVSADRADAGPASRCSTTSVRAKGGRETSSWTAAPTCRASIRQWFGDSRGTGKATRSW